jgi:hypothetical protein
MEAPEFDNCPIRPLNYYTGTKMEPNGILYEFADDKKCNGIIAPIYIPDGCTREDAYFVMFKATGTSMRPGQIEFLGGSRDESDETAMHTAVREAYEESCRMLNVSISDLFRCPYKKVWSSFIFYLRVPQITNEMFQKYRQKTIDDSMPGCYLEMDELVLVPIKEFTDPITKKAIFPPKKKIMYVKDINGVTRPVWQLAAMAAWGFFSSNCPLNETGAVPAPVTPQHCWWLRKK